MTIRRGFCKDIVEMSKNQPTDDNRPVHLLSTGGSIDQERIARRDKSGEQAEVACPRILKNYKSFMGGVDVHDQLRLQRQVQLSFTQVFTSTRFEVQEILQQPFLGFIDLVIVNSVFVSPKKDFPYQVPQTAPLGASATARGGLGGSMQHTANAYEGEKAWATCAGRTRACPGGRVAQ
ncbi:hypothetical protein GQ600_9698 [Phytophthora cactorum]|nr:hypothetical protein GQ600_9698 [Phytophthora cactorum]